MRVYQKSSVLTQYLRDRIDKVKKKLFKRFDTPLMKSKELDLITEILTKLQPKHCLEWGSGFSTLLFPKITPNLVSWLALEHNKEWFDFVQKSITDSRVELVFKAADNLNFGMEEREFDKIKDGLYEDFKSYIEYPRSVGRKFDFIFIDGRARQECLKIAYDLLTDDGIVVIHDANRKHYTQSAPPFEDSLLFTDYDKDRNVGGIWIGAKHCKVSKYLDFQRHQELWRGHDLLYKYLFKR